MGYDIHPSGAQTTGYITVGYYDNMISYNHQGTAHYYRYVGSTADMTSAGYYKNDLDNAGWGHYVWTVDSSGNIRMHLNGELILGPSQVIGSASHYMMNGNYFMIGELTFLIQVIVLMGTCATSTLLMVLFYQHNFSGV